MTRIAVGGFLHETNTFAPTKATFDDFVHGGGWPAMAQETWGWVPKEAAEEVARILGLTAAHVDGVLTFYTMYNLNPVGKSLIQICTSISCHLAGA